MEHSAQIFNQDVLALRSFKSKADLDDVIERLEALNVKTSNEDICLLKDQLEGIMHAPGAGSIVVKNKSLPQICQKILLHLNCVDELFNLR